MPVLSSGAWGAAQRQLGVRRVRSTLELCIGLCPGCEHACTGCHMRVPGGEQHRLWCAPSGLGCPLRVSPPGRGLLGPLCLLGVKRELRGRQGLPAPTPPPGSSATTQGREEEGEPLENS